MEVCPFGYDDIINRSSSGEKSSVIRDRVVKARKIQEARYILWDLKGIHCNAVSIIFLAYRKTEIGAKDLGIQRIIMPPAIAFKYTSQGIQTLFSAPRF